MNSALGIEEGTLIDDKYRVLEPLGIGGMGSIWLAHNQTLDIEVAVKVLRADLGKTPKEAAASRMLQEARAAAKLIHPAIVRINDYGRTAQGDPYLVMERLRGIDLATALDNRGRIGAVKSVRTLLPIVDALAFAHEREVIHRDVKPENIFLCQTDEGKMQPKLIDFGVARLEERVDRRLTSPGAMMGSPGYMAPEQARGCDADERADLWALCVVLYEMVTGTPPFDGESLLALVRAIVEDEVVPIGEYGVGDAELWRIISTGLTKDPDARWQSARELGLALAEWLLENGVQHDICGANIIDSWSPRPELRSAEEVLESEPPPSHVTDLRDRTPAAWGQTPRSWPGITPSQQPSSPRLVPSSARSPGSGPISRPRAPGSGPISQPQGVPKSTPGDAARASTPGSSPAEVSAGDTAAAPTSGRLRELVETQPLPVLDEIRAERSEPPPPRSAGLAVGHWKLAVVALAFAFAVLALAWLGYGSFP